MIGYEESGHPKGDSHVEITPNHLSSSNDFGRSGCCARANVRDAKSHCFIRGGVGWYHCGPLHPPTAIAGEGAGQVKRKAWVIPAILLVAACSSTSYQHALDVSLTALNQASNSFVTYDKEKQLQLVDETTTKEEAHTALKAYRATRAPVVAAFLGAYGAIAVAAVKADGASITEAGKAVLLVYEQLKKLFPREMTP